MKLSQRCFRCTLGITYNSTWTILKSQKITGQTSSKSWDPILWAEGGFLQVRLGFLPRSETWIDLGLPRHMLHFGGNDSGLSWLGVCVLYHKKCRPFWNCLPSIDFKFINWYGVIRNFWVRLPLLLKKIQTKWWLADWPRTTCVFFRKQKVSWSLQLPGYTSQPKGLHLRTVCRPASLAD